MIDTAMLVARVVGFAATGSVRPVATLFAVQLLTAGVIHFDVATIPAEAAWSVSPLALGAGLAACAVEWLFQHTEGADALARTLHADKLVAAVLAMPTAFLLVSLTAVAEQGVERVEGAVAQSGLTPEQQALVLEQAGSLADEALGNAPAASATEADDLVKATRKLTESGRSPLEQAGFLGLAVLMNLGLVWLRGEVRDFVESLHLERIWAWLETGGVFAGLALLALAPAIGLVFILLGVLACVALWVGSRFAASLMDAARRRPCAACAKKIRVEAIRCRFCNVETEPVRWLGQGEAPTPVGALVPPH